MRPFLGQLGTTPSTTMPDSHNAGDFGAFLVGAPHKFALDGPALQQHKTDGHLDIDAVRAGAMLVCPVKVPGGGVYLGDMHAMQGDGEIAGHTADVAGTVTLQVEVIKGLGIDGPVLFPLAEDLPFLAKPLTAAERARAEALAAREGVGALEESLPVSVIGTGPDLNSATDNGLARAAELLGMSVPEVMNRATIAGAIEIGRAPGVVQVTFRAPAAALRRRPDAATQRSCMPERDGFAPGTPELGRPRHAGRRRRRGASTASCSAGRRSRPGRSRRPAATSSSSPTGAGWRASSPLMAEGQPVVWSTYFATDDVDALAARVTEFGGTSLFDPMDVMDAGPHGLLRARGRRRVRRLAGRDPHGRRARQRARSAWPGTR